MDDMSASGDSGPAGQIRKDFPETWMWETIQSRYFQYALERVVVVPPFRVSSFSAGTGDAS